MAPNLFSAFVLGAALAFAGTSGGRHHKKKAAKPKPKPYNYQASQYRAYGHSGSEHYLFDSNGKPVRPKPEKDKGPKAKKEKDWHPFENGAGGHPGGGQSEPDSERD